jgi:hypothetical protein
MKRKMPDYPRGGAAADVWAYATRALTDKAGFTISGTKQTLDALNDITAASVWAVAARTLTAFTGQPRTDLVGADNAIWANATRTLTALTGQPRSDLLGEDASFEVGTGVRKAKIDSLLGTVTEVEGTMTLTGSEQNLILTSDNKSHVVTGQIDLSNMQAGDTVEVIQYMMVKSGGTLRSYADEVYSGVQTLPLLNISTKRGKYGIKVTIKQTAGTFRTVDYLFEKEMKT